MTDLRLRQDGAWHWERRSEYRRRLDEELLSRRLLPGPVILLVEDTDAAALAVLLLDAYRGSIDDEGEDESDARAAIDDYLTKIERFSSVVLEEDARRVAMSFVFVGRDVRYIDPVATASHCKRRGYGSALVAESMRHLAAAAVPEVGAVVTDGNTASERLFSALGFARVGAWPRGTAAG